ncbi:hypothetical protein Pres01_23000 [Metapseudomonas resinovorans]|uniref:hypothetical protein n=1 Tax=Metapseudomonas resinovorans TaxID=53412 RepID=UPI0009855B7C|nr:hypothetical protein [Pseudomonas resinovorans]GLZ86249.1 hypothetical protein Pres01_23000 [Pseudomonas resinovorans]
MNTAALREVIHRALENEAASTQLSQILETQIASLHPAIRLPEEDAQGVLARFIAAYVEQVPDVLDAAATVAREAGIESRIKPVLKVAEQFFLQPPALMAGHNGLEGLLDEAYLAHRLVEEVNDRYIVHFGQPLIPLDTTVANLIAHQLIGEPFANQLDEAVHHAVDGLLDEEVFSQPSAQAYRQQLHDPKVEEAWKRWPCMSEQLGVGLELNLGQRAAG